MFRTEQYRWWGSKQRAAQINSRKRVGQQHGRSAIHKESRFSSGGGVQLVKSWGGGAEPVQIRLSRQNSSTCALVKSVIAAGRRGSFGGSGRLFTGGRLAGACRPV